MGRTQDFCERYVRDHKPQDCHNADIAHALMESRGEADQWRDHRKRNNAENQISRVMKGLESAGKVHNVAPAHRHAQWKIGPKPEVNDEKIDPSKRGKSSWWGRDQSSREDGGWGKIF